VAQELGWLACLATTRQTLLALLRLVHLENSSRWAFFIFNDYQGHPSVYGGMTLV